MRSSSIGVYGQVEFPCFKSVQEHRGVPLTNPWIARMIVLFSLTYTILILYAGCSRVGLIPEAGAAPAVPVILLFSAWITKIIVLAIW
jgi:hypothetical protein